MSDPVSLTDLTLKDALGGLRDRRFSSEEITRAHLQAMEMARPLNAYVLETPDEALAMARASDARIAAGEAGPLEGRLSGSKTSSAPKGCAPPPARGSWAISYLPTNPPSPPTCFATGR